MNYSRPMTTCAVYVRQSQYFDGSISEEIQLRECQRFIERQGWTLAKDQIYKDIDLSGTSIEKRTGLRALRRAYDSGRFDVAVAHSVSRFSRNMQDGTQIIAEMPLATVLEGVPPKDDDFVPLLHMLLAHKFSREMSRRWKETHNLRIEKGLDPTGHPRFGYLTENGIPTPDPATAPLLREAYSRYIEGQGFDRIAQWLNERGTVTPRIRRPWSGVTVMDMLDSGFAAGYFTWRGETFKGAHTPLLSEDDWQTYLRVRRARKAIPKKIRNSDWPLAGLLSCEKCGGGMSRNHSPRAPSAVRCSSRYSRGSTVCEGQRYHLEALEGQISTFLRDLYPSWSSSLPDTASLKDEIAQARQSLSETTKAITHLTTLLARAVLSEGDYRASRDELEAERLQAQERLDALQDRLYASPDLEQISEGLQGEGLPPQATVRAMIARIGFNDDGLHITDTNGTAHFLPRATITR